MEKMKKWGVYIMGGLFIGMIVAAMIHFPLTFLGFPEYWTLGGLVFVLVASVGLFYYKMRESEEVCQDFIRQTCLVIKPKEDTKWKRLALITVAHDEQFDKPADGEFILKEFQLDPAGKDTRDVVFEVPVKTPSEEVGLYILNQPRGGDMKDTDLILFLCLNVIDFYNKKQVIDRLPFSDANLALFEREHGSIPALADRDRFELYNLFKDFISRPSFMQLEHGTPKVRVWYDTTEVVKPGNENAEEILQEQMHVDILHHYVSDGQMKCRIYNVDDAVHVYFYSFYDKDKVMYPFKNKGTLSWS